MEDAFQKMRIEGKNSVDNLVKWLQDSKIIDQSKEAEVKARKLFEDAKDKQNVELEKFKEAVTKLAEEQKKKIEEVNKMLSDAGPKVVDAIQAGLKAFNENLAGGTSRK